LPVLLGALVGVLAGAVVAAVVGALVGVLAAALVEDPVLPVPPPQLLMTAMIMTKTNKIPARFNVPIGKPSS
jgi:tetrahydromethanopterin S-methyltransferase subunit C